MNLYYMHDTSTEILPHLILTPSYICTNICNYTMYIVYVYAQVRAQKKVNNERRRECFAGLSFINLWDRFTFPPQRSWAGGSWQRPWRRTWMTSQKIINRTKQQALHLTANFYRSLFSLFILPLVFPSWQI